jgi:hypothetical protein
MPQALSGPRSLSGARISRTSRMVELPSPIAARVLTTAFSSVAVKAGRRPPRRVRLYGDGSQRIMDEDLPWRSWMPFACRRMRELSLRDAMIGQTRT